MNEMFTQRDILFNKTEPRHTILIILRIIYTFGSIIVSFQTVIMVDWECSGVDLILCSCESLWFFHCEVFLSAVTIQIWKVNYTVTKNNVTDVVGRRVPNFLVPLCCGVRSKYWVRVCSWMMSRWISTANPPPKKV